MYTVGDELEGLEAEGAKAYATFNRAHFLRQPMRQTGNDKDVFSELLLRIRTGNISADDIKLLETRNVTNLTAEEQEDFASNAITLFGEVAPALVYNEYRLEQMPGRLVEVRAVETKEAPKGVEHILKLKVGARVMINRNLNVEVSQAHSVSDINETSSLVHILILVLN